MSPAMKLGNWLRKVCPCVRKITAPLTEDGSEPEQELSVVDQIVFNVLRDNEVTGEGYERKGYLVLIGDLTVHKEFNSRTARVKYKGEDIGFCSNLTLFSVLDEKIRKYHERLEDALEPERIKRQQEREARLLEILREVSGK